MPLVYICKDGISCQVLFDIYQLQRGFQICWQRNGALCAAFVALGNQLGIVSEIDARIEQSAHFRLDAFDGVIGRFDLRRVDAIARPLMILLGLSLIPLAKRTSGAALFPMHILIRRNSRKTAAFSSFARNAP